MLPCDALDVDGDREMVAERQPGAEHGLDRHQPELLEASGIGLQGGLIGEVLEGASAPQCKGCLELRDSGGWITVEASAGFAHAGFEVERVQAVPIDPDGVAARVALDALAERLAKLRHVRLQRVTCGVGGRLAPHTVDQPVDRHRRVGFGEEQGEDEPLLRTAQSRLAARQGRVPPARTGTTARRGPSTSNLTAPS